MNYDNYLKIIISMLKSLDDSDIRFLNQLYTIIHRYLTRKRGD